MAKVCNFGRWPDSLCLLWCEGSVWAYIGRWGLALNKDICEAFCGEWSLTIWTLQHNWSLKNVHISMIFTYKVWIREKLFCISVAYFFSLTWRWTSQFPLHISFPWRRIHFDEMLLIWKERFGKAFWQDVKEILFF